MWWVGGAHRRASCTRWGYVRRRWQTRPSVGWSSIWGKNRRHRRLWLCRHLGRVGALVLTLESSNIKIKIFGVLKFVIKLENKMIYHNLCFWCRSVSCSRSRFGSCCADSVRGILRFLSDRSLSLSVEQSVFQHHDPRLSTQ